MDGLENLQKINNRITKDEAEQVLFETLKVQATQGDPKATMALVQIRKNPSEMSSILDKFYTPEEQVSPDEQALLDELGQAQIPGQPQIPQGPTPDIRSLLLQGGGSPLPDGGSPLG